ncbi:MAG: PQQ-like beta-propeller repeat protein [Acidobacteria bacterium]|nr:PQQ-like beta-propeller repeat protein [Acidobacteriota bacterium]
MLKKVGKAVGVGLGVLAVLAVGLYAIGLRVVLDGGGTPTLRFMESADERASALARHREAQRNQPPAPTGAPAPPSPGVAETPVPSAEVRALPPSPTRAPRAYWTNFRGPARDGHYLERPIRTDWPAGGLTPVWKQPVGGGYASFVAANGRAFTIEQRGGQEVVAAYDVPTGRELWSNAWSATFRESMGGDGPRATPTWHDGKVYALGAAGELRCLDDATGAMIWRTNILDDAAAPNLQWGMSAAPLVADDNVIVLPGGPGGKSVVAYNRVTGKQAWSALDDTQSYSSPMLVTLAGVRQILVFSASRLMGITPESGQVLWEFPWQTQYGVNASQPLLMGDRRIFISTGYGTGAAAIELSPEGAGRLSVKELWRTNRMKNQFTSSVLHEGFIYGLDEAILACIDAATGELKWKGGRYGYGQIMLASGHLIVVTEGGELSLVRANPDGHIEIARFPGLDGKTWNHPAISDGYLLVRNLNEMAAFDLRR